MKALLTILVLCLIGCAKSYQPIIVRHSFSVEQLDRARIDTAAVNKSLDFDVQKALKEFNQKQ